MKEYWTAAELAGVPGMPSTVAGVIKKAKVGNWSFRPHKGKGGGREYALSSLPEETRDHLVQQEVSSLPAPVTPVKSLAVYEPEPAQPLEEMKGWQREIFDARCIIYREFESLKKAYGTEKGITKLLALVETESLPEHLMQAARLANARRGKTISLSRALLLRWQKMVKQHGIQSLAPQPARQRQDMPEWASYFIKCYSLPQKPTIPEAMRNMKNILPEGMAMPSYDQVKRFNTQRSALDRAKGRNTGSELSKHKGYITRTSDDMVPGEAMVCDGHSFKAKVAHWKSKKPFHPEVCAVIDVATKVIFGWSAGVAESGQTVADALRHAMTSNEQKPYGCIPAIFYTDKGAGNMGKVNSHRETGFYARFGITHMFGRPGNAQGRGIIERANQSLWIKAAKDLPTFTGRDMDAGVKRKVYLLLNKAAKAGEQCDLLPNWQEFMACCQKWVDIYNHAPHSSLPKWDDPETGRRRHMAPLECLAVFLSRGWRPTTVPEALINDMFYPQIIRQADRGGVSLFGNRYTNHEVLVHYDGEVIVEYDIHDARHVRVRDRQQRLLCIASFDSTRKRYFPKAVSEVAMEQREQRRIALHEEHIATIKAENGFDQIKRLTPAPLSAAEEQAAQLLLETVPQQLPAEDLDAHAHLWAEPEPEEERFEFDESLLEERPVRDDRAELEKNAHLWAVLKEAPVRDAAKVERPKVVQAAARFEPEPNPDDDEWKLLEGWERYELLQRRGKRTDEQLAWMQYYEKTKEYQVLQSIYTDTEQSKKS